MTDLKQKDPLTWLDDAVERASGWKNLYFLKNGESDPGECVFDTEKAAKSAADEFFSSPAKTTEWRGIKILASEITHAIQIPVSDK